MNNFEQFEFDEEFEQKLLAFLVRDIAFFRKNSHVVKASYFVNKIREDVYDKAFQYSKKYKEPIPQEVLRQEITLMYKAQKKKDVPIDMYFDLIKDLYSRDLTGGGYAEEKVLAFAQFQEMATVLEDGAKRVMGGKDLKPILTGVTKVFEIGQAPSKTWEELTTSELVRAEPIDSREMIVEGLIPKGSVTFLYGKTGTCKTYLMLQMEEAIATGTPFFGRKTLPTPVYYVAYETTRGEFKERFNVIDSNHIVFWHRTENPAPPKLDSREFVTTFSDFPPGFIVFDALKSGMKLDIKENVDMSRIMEKLRSLTDIGHTVALLHNTTKADETKFSGAQTLADESDVCLLIRRVRAMGSDAEISEDGVIPFNSLIKLPLRFEITDKARFSFAPDDLKPMFFKFDKAVGGLYRIDSPDEEDMKRVVEEIGAWAEKIPSSKAPGVIAANLGMSKKRAVRLLRLCLDEKWLAKVPVPGSKKNEKVYEVVGG